MLSANTLLVDEISFINHLCKLKRIKDQIQNPVVHQQKLAPMMSIDYVALLFGVCFEENFKTTLEAYQLYQYISFCRLALHAILYERL